MLGAVYAADLAHVQKYRGALADIENGLRVQNSSAGAVACAIVFFRIAHLGILAHVERMNAIVTAILTAAVMDAAASHDVDVNAVGNMKIIVNQVVHTGFGNHNRDRYGFALSARLDIDINAGLILLGYNFDMLGRMADKALAVEPQVECALLRHFLHVCNLLEHHFLNFCKLCHLCFLHFKYIL